MAVLLISEFHAPEVWLPAIAEHLPDVEFRAWPDVGNVADIEIVLAYKLPPSFLATLPNLKAIVNLFAGVDPILADPDLPDVPIGRMVDTAMAKDMAQYVLLHTLRYFRQMPIVESHQREHKWEWLKAPKTEDYVVGVMGIGAMGGRVATLLAESGFLVRGWSRSPREMDGIETFHGEAGLEPFLGGTNILVNVLPKTAATIGLISTRTLTMLPRGAYLINIGRGEHVVDDDLLAALDSGQIAAATLDVFPVEPLPADDPYWAHPNVTVTPHHSGSTRLASNARVLAENIRRALAGEELLDPVDRTLGY